MLASSGLSCPDIPLKVVPGFLIHVVCIYLISFLVFWVVTSCGLVYRYRRLEGRYFHLPGWRWRQFVPSKRWSLPSSPHDVTTQKTSFELFTFLRAYLVYFVRFRVLTAASIKIAAFWEKARCIPEDCKIHVSYTFLIVRELCLFALSTRWFHGYWIKNSLLIYCIVYIRGGEPFHVGRPH
jgi:hypothetical protein